MIDSKQVHCSSTIKTENTSHNKRVKKKSKSAIKRDPKLILCKPKRVLQAVSILRQLNSKFYEASKKKPLFGDVSDKVIYLQFTMKKIPPQKAQKFIKVKLPTPLVDESTEICLITGDLDKRNQKAEIEPDILHYKSLLKGKGITQISEVVTLRQLRKEYKPFEAKRQLISGYDKFLCDKKIAGVLPKLLGKTSFKTRKTPIQIDMKDTQKLKKHVDNALSSTVFHVTCKGNSFASEVANLSMKDEDILSNISTSIKVLAEQIPGEENNILGIYLKTEKSKAIPLYMSFGDPNEVEFKLQPSKNAVVTEDISTLIKANVTVYKDGKVVVHKTEPEEGDEEDSEEEAVDISKFIQESKPRYKRKRSWKSNKKLKVKKNVVEEIIPQAEKVE